MTERARLTDALALAARPRVFVNIPAESISQIVVSCGIGEVFFSHSEHIVTFSDSPFAAH